MQGRECDEGMPNIYSAYGPKLKVQLMFKGEGRTKQAFKDECDINVIMARYKKTGVIEYVRKMEPQYADVSGIEYQSAMLMVANAQSSFEQLSSAIRARFKNDPAQFLDFVQDPRNGPEIEALGLGTLRKAKEPEAPIEVRVVQEPGARAGEVVS